MGSLGFRSFIFILNDDISKKDIEMEIRIICCVPLAAAKTMQC